MYMLHIYIYTYIDNYYGYREWRSFLSLGWDVKSSLIWRLFAVKPCPCCRVKMCITQLGTKVSHSNLTMQAICPLKTSKFSLIPDFVWVTVAFLAGDYISPLEIRPAIPAQIQAGSPFRSVRQVIHAQFDALHPAIETKGKTNTIFENGASFITSPKKVRCLSPKISDPTFLCFNGLLLLGKIFTGFTMVFPMKCTAFLGGLRAVSAPPWSDGSRRRGSGDALSPGLRDDLNKTYRGTRQKLEK